ncbi:Ribosomal RNA small subunit methyltransferase J [Vibrio stylophorae]|uniref:Ribosomal RNA small subunit methyltransferase J n=1 Tax=Vibrio stylophorae TaxID=659351 RepID=A0ABN8DMD0_9VIBR|nr:class I SAM-dependent methyltransferase [Vibrio stylophorae]CAH0532239.1 Ribosomal RNA small subunit methyltransferase J [Vibrio stylophorae]
MAVTLTGTPDQLEQLQQLALRWHIAIDEQSDFVLSYDDQQRLSLQLKSEPKQGAVMVDFTAGAVAHRRKFGGGKGQAIAKAIGLKSGETPRVLDATAGLGRDAFVLASLGCCVELVERHPVVAALLEDGLQRAYQDPEIGPWMQQRMTLHHDSSHQALLARAQDPELPAIDVVYLDPMFPHKKKSALVKKEMRVFQTLVGSDLDADDLLTPALALATKRVVVKRPDYAPDLNHIAPTLRMETKKNRFDVYVKAALSA